MGPFERGVIEREPTRPWLLAALQPGSRADEPPSLPAITTRDSSPPVIIKSSSLVASPSTNRRHHKRRHPSTLHDRLPAVANPVPLLHIAGQRPPRSCVRKHALRDLPIRCCLSPNSSTRLQGSVRLNCLIKFVSQPITTITSAAHNTHRRPLSPGLLTFRDIVLGASLTLLLRLDQKSLFRTYAVAVSPLSNSYP